MIEAGLIAARFVHYVGLILAFGAFAYAGFSRAQPEPVARRFRSLAVIASAMLLLGVLAVFAATVAGLTGSYAASADRELWRAVAFDSDFGRVWLLRLVLSACLVAIALVRFDRRGAVVDRVAACVALVLVVTVAPTGHTQIAEGTGLLVHQAADAIHIAAAAWLGALIPFVLLLTPTATGTVRIRWVVERLRAFHVIGVGCVIALGASGLVNSWFLVGQIDALTGTTYGRLVLVKVALFAILIAVGAYNQFRLVPALQQALVSDDGRRTALVRLRRSITTEFALALAVLLAAAVLGAIETRGHHDIDRRDETVNLAA